MNIGPQALYAFRDPLLRQSVGRNDQATIATRLKNVLVASDSEHHAALDDMLLALQSVGADLHAMSQASPQGAIAPWVVKLDLLLDSKMQIAMDESRNIDERVAAAKLLCRVSKHKETGVRLLAQLLKPPAYSRAERFWLDCWLAKQPIASRSSKPMASRVALPVGKLSACKVPICRSCQGVGVRDDPAGISRPGCVFATIDPNKMSVYCRLAFRERVPR